MTGSIYLFLCFVFIGKVCKLAKNILISIPEVASIFLKQAVYDYPYNMLQVVSKRLSLSSILDPAQVIRYDLIIGTDDNMSTRVNDSYSDARVQRRYMWESEICNHVLRGDDVLVCQYVTLNNYICYGHNGK
ncbi:hypothetical protein H8356DRAFT_1336991 [Neocallimastix lanati (nom. inval.)]|nr:hypothetical protein H8356DRAFT_1336991 [Neocallimastix sp. JGI-2020a]